MGLSEHKSDDTPDSTDDLRKQARELLALTDLVRKYPSVVSQRVEGLVYVLIGGGISLATLMFAFIIQFVGPLGTNMIAILAFMIFTWLIAYAVGFKLIKPLTQSYTKPGATEDELSLAFKLTWIVLMAFIAVLAIYLFGTDQASLFPPCLQIVMTIGQNANYLQSGKQKNTSALAKGHLTFIALIAVSIIPMLLFPPLSYAILILVDMGGIYGLGIYMLISAEKLLLETPGRD